MRAIPSRQLLVGFDKLTIKSVREFNLGLEDQLNIKVLETSATAILDKQTLKLATYSWFKANCLYDLVFWSSANSVDTVDVMKSPLLSKIIEGLD